MNCFWQTTDGTIRTYVGDALAVLREMPADSVHCCVTSPPYLWLRDYKVDGQIGLEETPAAFVARLVEVFREVRRVLHPSGVCWVNMGDSYFGGDGRNRNGMAESGVGAGKNKIGIGGDLGIRLKGSRPTKLDGIKPKDLIGVPWTLAFALRDDGWYLRQEIIWHKPAPMPESVTDRCTKAHEQVFLLAKNERYFYDAEAVKESSVRAGEIPGGRKYSTSNDGFVGATSRTLNEKYVAATANRRSVWTIASEPFPGSHFATFPSELIRPMIRAGSSERGCCPACLAPWKRMTEKAKYCPENGKRNVDESRGDKTRKLSGADYNRQAKTTTRGWQPTCECNAGDPAPCTILDPFGGSGTTGMVARQEGRACVMVELNPEYAAMHRARVMQVKAMADEDAPLFERGYSCN